MDEHMEKFKKAFSQGLSYEEAAKIAGIIPNKMLAEYWNLLTMEAAITQSNLYFARLIDLAS